MENENRNKSEFGLGNCIATENISHQRRELLVIEYLNSQSLLCHFEEIKLMLQSRDIDVLCICETWLDPCVSDVFLKIPNFNILRCDVGRGGGVCIYIRDDLNITIINTGIERCENIEDIWVQIQHKKFPSFIVGCMYRHPKALAASFDYINEVFKAVCLKNKPVFIFGDLNDNLLVGGSNLGKVIKNLNLKQMIDKATRITQTSSTLLDVVITNKSDMIASSNVFPSSIADHEHISVTINVRKPKKIPELRTFRSRKDYSQNIFCQLLLSEDQALNNILDTDNVSLQVDVLSNVFTKCLDRCAPVVTKEITRPPAPWIDRNLKKLITDKNKLQIDLKNDRSNQDLELKFKQSKIVVRNRVENAKSSHFKQKFIDGKGNSTAMWRTVDEMLPGFKNSTDKVIFENPSAKAEEFNEYFANVGQIAFDKSQEGISEDVLQNLPDATPNPDIPTFRPQPVDVETVILVIKHLKETSAVGSDGISLKYIKDALPVLVFYITVIINTSIVTGLFAKTWKHPHVLPYHKSGDVDQVTNYRPISLLPILSKVLEKIVANQLTSFLENNKLLAESQHGFRKGLSTETALLKVSEHIYSNIDKKRVSLLMLLDLSKAFDSVSHEILINKCNQLNVDGFWFEDYLRGRMQSVRIDSFVSSSRPINYGVPQGSILGPILFSIHINDMQKALKKYFLVQYADDAQIVISDTIENIGDLIKRAEAAFKDAKKYFQKNGLNVNEGKTQCVFIGSRQLISRIPPDIILHFGNASIIPLQSVKNLGVYMDPYMLFDVHVSHICRKVNGLLIYLNRVKESLDLTSRIIVVQSLVLSIINYCSKVWGMTTGEQLERVQKAQNFAAKVAKGGARKYDHVTPILRDLRWLNVENKISYDISVFTYKIIHGMLPSWLFSLPAVSAMSERATRQTNNLYIQRTVTDIGTRAITTRGPKIWNTLPDSIKTSSTVHCFKEKMKKFFLER